MDMNMLSVAPYPQLEFSHVFCCGLQCDFEQGVSRQARHTHDDQRNFFIKWGVRDDEGGLKGT